MFIDFFIKGTEPLPYEEYMAKLGYRYINERPSEDTRPSLGLQLGMNDKQQLTIVGMSESGEIAGIKKGDVPMEILGIEVNMENTREIFGKLNSMQVGDIVKMTVQRGDEAVVLNFPLQQRTDRHIFEQMEKPTEEQLRLREAWSKNL